MATETKVFAYHCYRPANEAAIVKQMDLAHRYYNTLIEIHRRRLRCRDDVERTFKPEWAASLAEEAAIAEELTATYDAIRRHKQRTRSDEVPGDLKEMAADGRRRMVEQRRKTRELRKVRIPDRKAMAEAMGTVDLAHFEEAKAAYAEFADLFWGTKNNVADRVAAACKTVRARGELKVPQFHRFDERTSDLLYCQVMGGMDVDAAYGSAGSVQIDGPPVLEIENPRKPPKRGARMRIGSTPNAKPIWAEVTATIARPLPPGGNIRGVQLVRKAGAMRRGSDGVFRPWYDWQLQLIVRMPVDPQPAQRGVIAIDTGWRVRGNDLRVATWADDQGNSGEWLLPEKLIRKWPRCRGLQSTRSTHYDGAHEALCQFLVNNPALPDWLAELKTSIPRWNSTRRLSRLVTEWKRFPGDETILHILRTWQDQEHHLEQWQHANTRRAERWRLDMFRCWAKKAAEQYGTIVVEDIDYAELRRRRPDDIGEPDDAVKHWRNVASSGKLVLCLEQAGNVKKIDPAGTTAVCHGCGATQEWDRAVLRHTCTVCGLQWDQDDNAAANLLARYFAGWADTAVAPVDPETPDAPVGRFARRRAAREKFLKELEAAEAV